MTADQVVANGVTIASGATIQLTDLGTATLTPGTLFTILSNRARGNPIDGTFSNLHEGAVVSVGNNTYKASYTGGTGNDLTLTVQ